MAKEFKYVEYNGWKAGYPTWNLALWLSNDESAYKWVGQFFEGEDMQENIEQFIQAIDNDITDWMDGEFIGACQDAIQGWAADNLGYLAGSVDWYQVHEALKDDRTVAGDADEPTREVWELLRDQD